MGHEAYSLERLVYSHGVLEQALASMDIVSRVVKASEVGGSWRNWLSICRYRRAENDWITLQMVSWIHRQSFLLGRQLIIWLRYRSDRLKKLILTIHVELL